MSIRLAALGFVSLSIVSVVACGGDDDNSQNPGTSTSSSSGATSSGDAGGKSSSSSSSTTSSSGNTATGGGPASCNTVSGNMCNSYSSIPSNATPSTYCALLGGDTTAVASCSSDNLFATCSFTSGGADQVIYYYKGGSFTATNTKTACDALSGTLSVK